MIEIILHVTDPLPTQITWHYPFFTAINVAVIFSVHNAFALYKVELRNYY